LSGGTSSISSSSGFYRYVVGGNGGIGGLNTGIRGVGGAATSKYIFNKKYIDGAGGNGGTGAGDGSSGSPGVFGGGGGGGAGGNSPQANVGGSGGNGATVPFINNIISTGTPGVVPTPRSMLGISELKFAAGGGGRGAGTGRPGVSGSGGGGGRGGDVNGSFVSPGIPGFPGGDGYVLIVSW
jgi:hypothetical protein